MYDCMYVCMGVSRGSAYSTLVISGIIMLGAVFLLYEVGLQFREWLSG
jgi:hypothetical protein